MKNELTVRHVCYGSFRGYVETIPLAVHVQKDTLWYVSLVAILRLANEKNKRMSSGGLLFKLLLFYEGNTLLHDLPHQWYLVFILLCFISRFY